MKITVNLNEEQQQFVKTLLRDTREQFAQAFRELATSNSKKDRRKFTAYWITLSELIVPRPVPVSLTEEELREASNEIAGEGGDS